VRESTVRNGPTDTTAVARKAATMGHRREATEGHRSKARMVVTHTASRVAMVAESRKSTVDSKAVAMAVAGRKNTVVETAMARASAINRTTKGLRVLTLRVNLEHAPQHPEV
jgi:hypothetical protein